MTALVLVMGSAAVALEAGFLPSSSLARGNPHSTPTPPPASTPTAGGPNLLSNGSFEGGTLSPWTFGVTSPAAGSTTLDASTAADGTTSDQTVVTSASANTWYVQLLQSGVAVTAGVSYTLSFWAKADAPRTDNFVIQQAISPYTLYLQQNFSTTTGWQQYTTTFTPTVSDSNVFIGFNLAGSTGTVWIDNVVFATSGSGPTPTPTATDTPVASPTATSTASGTASSIKTVFVIMMENTNWSNIAGNTSEAPYINSLVTGSNNSQTSYATQYYTPPGNHPSLPNYLWLEGGQCFTYCGTDNDPSTPISSTAHLVTQLDNAGISWKSYQESISDGTCPTSSSYPYAAKHDPFVYFGDVTGNTTYCTAHIRSYSDLSGDLSNNTVARYNFITPNLCDDMHDSCSPINDPIKQGDSWLQTNLPTILNSQAYQQGGAVFIVWDEGTSSSDGPIGMIVISPLAKGGGYNNAIHYTHSSTLRTMEEIFGVSPFVGDAANATDLSDLFRTFP
jgi:hypothetical protein